MSSIELVVFDIAGTTVRDNGSVADAFIASFRDFGFEMPVEEVKKVMGYRKMDAIALLLEKFAPAHKDDEPLIDRIHIRFIDTMIALYRDDQELAAFPHAEKLFSTLHERGIKIALNTGFTRSITDAILHRLRWDERSPLIDQTICSDEVPYGRPHPDMILLAMQRAGITDPREVVKIGDSIIDIEEGINAGASLNIGITTGAHTREQLESAKPNYIIDNLIEVLPLIT